REAADLDARLGELLDALGDDLVKQTIVVVTSDNGLHYGDHRFFGGGRKNAIYEPAARVPMVVAGPGFPAGRSVDVPVVLQDLTATFVAAGGAKADPAAPHPLVGTDL